MAPVGMTGIALTATIAAYVCLGTLAWSGLHHARRPQMLLRVLEQQGWRRGMRWLLGVSVIGLELTIGAAGFVAAVLGGADDGVVLPLSAAAVLYAVYALYGAVLTRRGDVVPCGCSGAASYPVNVWVVARALVLSVGSAFAAVAGRQILPLRPLTATVTLAVLASGALGLILWELPAALHDPRSSPLAQEGV
jgi:hypothetical protein